MPCVAEQAWVAIKYGSSLHGEAKRFGVNATVLDRAIWIWRGRRTGSLLTEDVLCTSSTIERLAS